jgi:hypothetical protein
MAVYGSVALMWFTLSVMIAMLIVFGLSYYVAQSITGGECETCAEKGDNK